MGITIKDFVPSQFSALPDQAKEADIPLEISDRKGRKFHIRVRIETKKAGIQALFFCENLLICRTQQRLAFHYNKKPNSQLPLPIVEDEEKTMMIFENSDTLNAILSENRDSQFSTAITVGTAGIIGDFKIETNQNHRQFNFAYSVQVWSVCKSITSSAYFLFL